VPDDIATERLCVAYEPVWAIGTGRVAGPVEILEAHALIRAFLRKRFAPGGNAMRILYGGSVKPDNAEQIISLDNVDGVLVGGASLQAETFARIALAGVRD
jgi:triosephosphate isomerase